MDYDVIVIGGGIVGASVFNQAVLKGMKAVLLEAENDVSAYASKANSGIIHAGYDPQPNSNMAIFNRRGSEMYPEICKRLGVPFLNCGSLVVTTEENRGNLMALYERGKKNKIPDLEVLERDALLKLEPNLADSISCGLFAKTAGLISPYLVCIALCEEGVVNGGVVKTCFKVCDIKREGNNFVVSNGKEEVKGKYVVNCAGPNVNDINKLVGAPTYDVRYVKGEYILLDKSQRGFVNRPIFPLPTKETKGILANATVHGNILFGPTATPCDKKDTTATEEGTREIKEKACNIVKNPNFRKTIKLFAGIRVKIGDDFVVGRVENVKNFYEAVGICSPGLSSAPAIAEHIVELLIEDGAETRKINFKKRKPYIDTSSMSKKELDELIKKDARYGKIICKCENISEGEIIDALNSPLKPTSVDAIKRRVRTTMGRCQGGFCLPSLALILAKHLKVKEEDITLDGEGGNIVVGDIKEGDRYEN